MHLEFPRHPPVGLPDRLSDRELARAVDCHEEIERALCGLDFGDVHVKNPIGSRLKR